jgi:hypothetical protein
MTRGAHFGIGLAILGLCVAWFYFGVFIFFAAAAGKDSRGASLSDFVPVFVVFGGGFLFGFCAAFLSFRRALRRESAVIPPPAPTSPHTSEVATPDQRLAHLVKNNDKI